MKASIKPHPTLPPFGQPVPGAGGRLGAIMRGQAGQPDYAVIVPDIPAILLPWGNYGKQIAGADSPTDGAANTATMLAAGLPAAQHIHKLRTTEGHADLYLGARGEMSALFYNVPELFEKEWHWTSTQLSARGAFAQGFALGDSYWYGKDDKLRVRALRRIPLQHFNA